MHQYLKSQWKTKAEIDICLNQLDQTFKGQTNILDGAIFLISFLTSKSDGVYPGSPKNTFFSKIF